MIEDVQYGVQTIFGPPSGFRSTYTLEDATSNPIYLFPTKAGQPEDANVNVDPLSVQGLAGYAPLLARGLSVPMGGRCLLWLPSIFYDSTPAGGSETGYYEFLLIWRLRNLADFANDRRPYHIPSRSGVTDTSANEPRFAVPAAVETVSFKQTEPASTPLLGNTNAYPTLVTPNLERLNGPIGVKAPLARQPVQQGVLDPGFVGESRAITPNFLLYETSCKGDELLIAVRRPDGGNWAFDTTDENFSNSFTDSNLFFGVYCFTGIASSFSTVDMS